MTAAKPDCTGQRFGFLTVIGKGEVVKSNGKSRRLWQLLCDCGNTISLPRGDFDRRHGGQKSCGCQQSIGGGKPRNIAGQKFGSLTAIRLTGNKDKHGKPTWLLQCDCGKTAEMSLSRIGQGYRLNCGDLSHQPGLHYPPMPKPMPVEVGELASKYLRYTQTNATRYNADEQDERINRLIRASWIVTYKRSQGEYISNQHEKRFILKHLRFARSAVKLRKLVESGGHSRYTFTRYKAMGIGSEMTNVTSFTEAVAKAKTQPESLLSISRKRIKFKRC